jgi:hypothetical protein
MACLQLFVLLLWVQSREEVAAGNLQALVGAMKANDDDDDDGSAPSATWLVTRR